MDPIKKDQEGLGDKQTPGSNQDDSGKEGGDGIDTDGLSDRQKNQVSGLKSALNTRDADISLLDHGLRFVADNSYIQDLPEDVGRKVIDRLKRSKAINIDVTYEDIVAGLGGEGGQKKMDEGKIADIAVKRIQSIQDAKETDKIVSEALEEIEDEEIKKKFQEDYNELSGGKKLAPKAAKRLADTLLNGYRFELQNQKRAQERVLGIHSSQVQGTKVGGTLSSQSSKKHYESCKAAGWSEDELAKYYPEFHTSSKK